MTRLGGQGSMMRIVWRQVPPTGADCCSVVADCRNTGLTPEVLEKLRVCRLLEDSQLLTQCRQHKEPWVQLQLCVSATHSGPDYSVVCGCWELAWHLIALAPGTGWAELLMAQPLLFVHCNKYGSEGVTFLISKDFISPPRPPPCPKLTTPL